MSILEQLGISTVPLESTSVPFKGWTDSPIKEWSFTMRILTIGDLVEISRATAGATPIEASYLSKIHLLARSLVAIKGQPIVALDDIEKYNKEHNLSGRQQVDIYEYKVLFMRKLTEPVVNRLAFMYDELQDEYLTNHLGVELSDELKAAKIGEVDLSNISPSAEEVASDEAT